MNNNIKETKKSSIRDWKIVLPIAMLIVIGLFFVFIFNIQHFLKEEVIPTLKLTVPYELTGDDIENGLSAISLPLDTYAINYTSYTYSWNYKWYSYRWEILVPDVLNYYFKNLSRAKTENYAIYVIHPYQIEALEMVHNCLQQVCIKRKFNEEETIKFLTCFVGSTEYLEDKCNGELCEYPKYPIETLCDNGGDCEDKSILLASILKTFGFKVALIENDLGDSGHMIVGVAGDTLSGQYYVEEQGNKYYALDVTNQGYGIGGINKKYTSASLRIRLVDSAPIILHSFHGAFVDYNLELIVTVENEGTVDATDLFIRAGFDASNDQLWNVGESSKFDLQIGEEKEVVLTLRPPYGKNTRLIVQVIDDGHVINTRYSEWGDL